MQTGSSGERSGHTEGAKKWNVVVHRKVSTRPFAPIAFSTRAASDGNPSDTTELPLCTLPGHCCVEVPIVSEVCASVPSAAFSFPVPAICASPSRQHRVTCSELQEPWAPDLALPIDFRNLNNSLSLSLSLLDYKMGPKTARVKQGSTHLRCSGENCPKV